MATINEQLTQLSTAKTNIMSQLQAKGSDITTSTPLSEYSSKIRALVVAEGDAQPENVLTSKTFSNNGGSATGTMVNNGALNVTITPEADVKTFPIPAGYHSGSGKITIGAINKDIIYENGV